MGITISHVNSSALYRILTEESIREPLAEILGHTTNADIVIEYDRHWRGNGEVIVTVKSPHEANSFYDGNYRFVRRVNPPRAYTVQKQVEKEITETRYDWVDWSDTNG